MPPRGGGRGGGSRAPLPRDVMISKKISYVLRHGAEKEGLKLDGNGYANCADLLQWRPLSSLRLTFPELKSIVATNDKQRFQLIPISSPSPTTTSSSPEPDPAIAQSDSSPDQDPSKHLIRASQGHSLPIASAALLTPILPTDPDFPSEVVHGTFPSAWAKILSSGGLSKMGRQHVHFAVALGSVYKVKSTSKDKGKAEEAQEPGVGSSRRDLPEVDEEEERKVISGIRNTTSVFVWVDVRKSMEEGGLRWWRSKNGVVLTEGDERGMVPLEFVARTVQQGKGVIWGEVKKHI